jgi:hypothetical protein
LARASKPDPFDAILSHELRGADGIATGECPEASVLAAYFEHSLGGAERARWERHFADCPRCTAALAAMARVEAATAQPVPSHRAFWKALLAHPTLATTAGATAAALCAVIILTLYRAKPTAETQFAMSQRGALSKGGPEESGRNQIAINAARPPSTPSQARQATSGKTGLAGNARLQELRPEPSAAAARETAQSSTSESKVLAKRDLAASASAQRAAGGEAGLKAAAPPVAPNTPIAMAPKPGPAAANVPNAPPASASSAARQDTLAALPGASATIVENSDHSAVWLVGEHGSISRYSMAGGWQPQKSGVDADLTAGSAPSRTVCWVVGRAGTVLQTVDGEHWRKVPPPTDRDLVAVDARGASEAVVITADGRKYRTSDSGATWQPM